MNNRIPIAIALCPLSGEYYYAEYKANSDLDQIGSSVYNIGLARQNKFELIKIDKSLLDSLSKSAYNRYIKSRSKQ